MVLSGENDQANRCYQRQNDKQPALYFGQRDVQIVTGDNRHNGVDTAELEAAKAKDMQRTEANSINHCQLGAQQSGDVFLGGLLHNLSNQSFRIGYGNHDQRTDQRPNCQCFQLNLTCANQLGAGAQNADDSTGADHCAQRDNCGANDVSSVNLCGLAGCGLDYGKGTDDQEQTNDHNQRQENGPYGIGNCTDHMFYSFKNAHL